MAGRAVVWHVALSWPHVTWTTRGLDHTWLGPHVAWSTRGLDHTWIGPHVAWTTRVARVAFMLEAGVSRDAFVLALWT